jgi:glycosyltransferase involved in cell wall biosynthesis
VRPNETGYLVPPANASALAEALEAVYTNPAKATHLAETGRALVLKEFALRTNVSHLAALLARASQAR